jgi:hypothetical protein
LQVTANGLNVGGTNPNVTFAPLGVGSGQQNSNNSAGSQPTTQSNLGFSVGLIGGFGATHSGSTSTTTQSNLGFSAGLVVGFGATHSGSTSTTIQSNLGFSAGLVGGFGATPMGSNNTTTVTSGSNHDPRKKGNSTMLSPYSKSTAPLSLTGTAKYINFVKSPYNKRIDCLVGNHNLIFAGLAKKAKQYSMAILRVPTSDIGKMAEALLTINTISLANVDFGSYINILSKHTTKLTNDQLCPYSSWFFGAEDKQLATHKTPSDMVACLVNLEATGK